MKANFAIALFSVVCFGACLDADPTAPAQPGVESVPRLSSNGLGPNKIVTTNLGLGALTGTTVNQLAQTQDGRDYLTYIVGCAFGNRQNVTTGSIPNQYTFYGDLGVATAWNTRALTQSERRWVS